MFRKLFALFVFTVLCLGISHAVELRGVVKDAADGKAISGAMVIVKDAKGIPVAFAYIDNDGLFTLDLPDGTGNDLTLQANILGYAVFTKEAPFPEYMEIEMTEKPFELKEAVVVANQVELKGDTVTYYIPSIISKEDKVLADVLRKLPGVTVDREGYVKVYGKPINKFYIEGSDLLEHRYNIATENIDPEMISKVEVYEKHQPRRALEGIVESDQAALNIVLKEGMKSKWIAALQAEAGGATEAPYVPYSASAMLMNVGKKFQTVNLLKTDAAGNDITLSLNETGLSYDMYNLDFMDRYNPVRNIGISHAHAPIDADRSRFNTTYSVSSNNKFNAGKDLKIGVTGLYENEALRSDNSIYQTYDLADGTKNSFHEINSVKSSSYIGYGNVSAEINTRKLFFRDNFQFEFSGSRAANTLGGTESRGEDAGVDGMNFLNYLTFTARTEDKKAFGLSMFTQYSEQNENMLVTSPSEDYEAEQDITGKYFYNRLMYNMSFGLARNLTLSSHTYLDYLHRRFVTSLAAPGISGFSPENDVMLQYLRPKETLFLEYAIGRLELSVDLDLWYQYFNYILAGREQKHRFAANPALRVEYTFGPRFSIEAGGAFALSPVSEQQIYDGLIMRNYKYLTQGRTSLTQTPQYNVYAELDFKDPLSGWYLKGTGMWNASRSFELTRYFIGNYIVNKESDEVTDYSYGRADVEVSKAFLEISGKVTAGFSFGDMKSTIVQNDGAGGDVRSRYDNYTYSGMLSFVGSVSKWLGIAYEGQYTYSIYRTGGAVDEGDNHSMSHSLTLTFHPCESVEMDLSGEYYFDKYADYRPAQTVFLDASVWYYVSRKVQIFLHAKNLLDRRTYSYSYLSPLQITRYEYRIRPLNVLLGVQVKF